MNFGQGSAEEAGSHSALALLQCIGKYCMTQAAAVKLQAMQHQSRVTVKVACKFIWHGTLWLKRQQLIH